MRNIERETLQKRQLYTSGLKLMQIKTKVNCRQLLEDSHISRHEYTNFVNNIAIIIAHARVDVVVNK